MEPLTIRNFGGGLNAVDSDISMAPQFSVVLDNLHRTPSGALKLRFGSKWFVDIMPYITNDIGNIVNMHYFAGAIVAAAQGGQIVAADDNGVAVSIWNATLAAALPGAPSPWSGAVMSVDFVPFKAKLIAHNGLDKPLSIGSGLGVSYLADEVTGSNVNVPIGKYGCVVANYHCVAGIPAAPTTVYVSSKGTAGTFPGDPVPNDSISIDVGAYAPEGAPEIRGIAGFRSFLIVFFASQALPIRLGTYNGAGVHVPEFPDVLPSFGLLGHRCVTSVVGDLQFAGFNSIGNATRSLFSGLIDPSSLSDIVEPAYRRLISNLTDDDRLRKCFVVHDRLAHKTILYTPTGSFAYSANDKLRYKAWSQDTTQIWESGCVSFLGRVFFSSGSRIFQQGNDIFTGEAYHADRLNDRSDNWQPGHSYTVGNLAYDTVTHEVYICVVSHISGGVSFSQDRADQILSPKWELYKGEPISFEWESPWLDGKDPMRLKITKYIALSTKGTAEFTVRIWVDHLYKDIDGNVIHDPAVSIKFIANDALGFGYDAGPYGGGRHSNDPRLFEFPAKFKSVKIGIIGSDRKPFELALISFLYAHGKFTR